MKDFLISYTKSDEAWAEWIAWVLESAGYRIVFQKWHFRAGGNFVSDMQHAMASCRRTIAVLSPEFLQARFPVPEWGDAVAKDPDGQKRLLIPVRISSHQAEGWFRTRTWIDLVALSQVNARKALLEGLNDNGKPKSAPPFPGKRARKKSPPFPGHESHSVQVLQEKLTFLRDQSSASTESSARNHWQIEAVESQLTSLRRRSNDSQRRYLEAEIAQATARKANLEAVGADTKAIATEIQILRRELRRGTLPKQGDALGKGRYCLIDEIGGGGFSTVWRALDRSTDGQVAIKILLPHKARNLTDVERFARGARIMRKLDHEGIVRVLSAVNEDDDCHYFVMELISGSNLRDAVIEKRVKPTEAPRILERLLDAICHAHNKGYIHRDIKPENILLDSAGSVKIADFDLVSAHDTTGGTVGGLGTYRYSAPEQLDNADTADERSDVYSIAMTALFLLNGQDLPHEACRRTNTFIDKLQLKQRLATTLKKALALAPAKRFQSAEEFRDAYLNALGDNRKILPRKRRAKRPASAVPEITKRFAVPQIRSRKNVEQAIERFDKEFRNSGRYKDFQTNTRHTYALLHDGKYYPIKKIIELATGVPVAKFSQGPEARERLASHGFTVVKLHDNLPSQVTQSHSNSQMLRPSVD